MKQVLFLFLILSLSVGFSSCDSDDDYEKVRNEKLQAEYTKLVYDIIEYQKQVDVMQAKYDAAQGGYKLVLWKQLSPMLDKLNKMKARKREIESILGIK